MAISISASVDSAFRQLAPARDRDRGLRLVKTAARLAEGLLVMFLLVAGLSTSALFAHVG